jgi:hypothetical protein
MVWKASSYSFIFDPSQSRHIDWFFKKIYIFGVESSGCLDLKTQRLLNKGKTLGGQEDWYQPDSEVRRTGISQTLKSGGLVSARL